MFGKKQIQKLFKELNAELKMKNLKGEIGICGGAVMCLVFNSRTATKDIDAVFVPTQEIRNAAKKIAKKNNLNEDWLNDAAKGYFFKDPPREKVLELSHLRVWAPTADYMLAMKSVSARYDTHDKDDIIFLIGYLELKHAKDVFAVIQKYYSHEQIPAKTTFLIEELFEKPKSY